MWRVVERVAVSVGQAVVWVKVFEGFAFGDTLSLSSTSIHSNTGKWVSCTRGDSRMVLLHRTLVPLAPDLPPYLLDQCLVGLQGQLYTYRWWNFVHKHSVLPDIHRGSHFLKC